MNPKWICAFFLFLALAACRTAPEAESTASSTSVSAKESYTRGQAAFDRGDYAQAISEITKVIEADPSDASAYTMRGSAYLELLEYKKAIADLDEAIRLDQDNPRAFFHRGKAYF